MKIWTNEHVFNHNWETVTQSQWRKYPNPHNTAVLGGDVISRSVCNDGILHSHRIVISDFALAPWVQRLIGANRECLAHEHSICQGNYHYMAIIQFDWIKFFKNKRKYHLCEVKLLNSNQSN